MGGYSLEHNISLKSGAFVMRTINYELYNVFKIVISKEKWIYINEYNNEFNVNKDDFTVNVNGNVISFDSVFIIIHGDPGENGILQKYFEELKIPFTGPNSKTAELTFNKKKCIDFVSTHSINTAKSFLLEKDKSYDLNKIINKLNFPMFVKANNSGSSFGVYKAYNKDELNKFIVDIFKIDNEIIIERFIDGREFSIGVTNFDKEIKVLAVTELISENDFFDYEAKYEGKHKEVTPANINLDLENKLKKEAKKIYEVLKLSGFSRIDFIVENQLPYFLEINTIPGMTEHSIFPKQLRLNNLNMTELFTEIIQNTLK
ncbi:MAG: D-alanine--D-alanine ligase [Flavobacteriaceae bacterium]|nr:D-alanine--D-alanine ligase [Flavobacteriaceae bacterium]MBL6684714.1 D-alanine--D-alanine ligase [Flavobacteriaceae bacterium]